MNEQRGIFPLWSRKTWKIWQWIRCLFRNRHVSSESQKNEMKNQIPLKISIMFLRKKMKKVGLDIFTNENVENISRIRFKWESYQTKLNEIIELRKNFNLGVIRFILFNSKQNVGIADPAEDLSVRNVLGSTLHQFRFIVAQKFSLRPVCCQSERDKSLYLSISK